MKIKKTLASVLLAGSMALTGCSDTREVDSQIIQPSKTIYVTTAENVRIEPYYETDPTLMDGIVVTRSAYGNGLDVQDIEESTRYPKGSLEYEALRPLLTVERQK